ncbi:MAG: hypothetical protein COT91_03930 [Candidatus Doudnabacteria bacterium CG10_big_fil_rev_8_21_14_0_10_41_10]|uniref:Uncharacterized protein n=1 Tax=Candidatus Doudnabacteria bacterium CG10_big_fil_rev_8_21_14_0_10_41_10 TaxID=1974551 RepID=A0A2H0VCZ9_9BACT|nr:MAG: hypothetical protein COT91_03930 [Candidatus Doudnabacteria bacterium CG10_big_fil_rev_8_21_14_0_10_41_10]
MQLPENIELALQEKVINIVEALQGVSRRLWVGLVATIILIIPLSIGFRIVFKELILNAYVSTPITYVSPSGEDLRITDKGIVSVGDSRYGAYARVVNPNNNVMQRSFEYEFILSDSSGDVLEKFKAESYILPDQERALIMPASFSGKEPVSVEVLLSDPNWIRARDIQSLSFIFENQTFGLADGQFVATAVLRNDNPYIIPEIEITSLLLDINHKVVGANFTTVNDVLPRESRFFRHVWPGELQGEVALVEFRASVNQMKKGSLLTEEANIFDQFDGRE